MKSLITTAVLSLLATAATQAKVLIYKGAAHAVSDTESGFPRFTQTFFIVDPDQSVIGSVNTLVAGGKKLILVIPPDSFRISEAPLAFGKTATTFSQVTVSGGANESYSHIMIHARGTNTSLPSSSSITGNITNFPRIFHGISLQDSAFANKGSFTEQRFVLSYQTARTIAANDANRTAQQAVDALVEELKLSGFVLP
jgi:hypothetical protein